MSNLIAGPWQYRKDQPGKFVIFANTPEGELRLGAVYGRIGKGVSEPVAKLWAAAPEMLDALHSAFAKLTQLAKDLGPCDHPVNVCVCDLWAEVEYAQAAIRKAEGKESA